MNGKESDAVGQRLGNHVQNCLSELFSHGHLAADLGIKTVTAGYRTLKGMKHNEYKTKTNTLETPRLSRETHLKFHFVSITQLRQVTLPYVWVMLYEKKGGQMGGNSTAQQPETYLSSLVIVNAEGDTAQKDFTNLENWESSIDQVKKTPSQYEHEYVFQVSDLDF